MDQVTHPDFPALCKGWGLQRLCGATCIVESGVATVLSGFLGRAMAWRRASGCLTGVRRALAAQVCLYVLERQLLFLTEVAMV